MDYPTLLSSQPGDYRCEINVVGRTRSFRVHLPEAMPASGNWPVIVAYHGSGTHAGTMEAFTGLNDLADEVGCVVVYPNGTGRTRTTLSWNVGRFNSFAAREGVADVAFASALLSHLQQRLPLDPGQIFVTGFSNGAMLAYRLADELSESIAAIAPIAGPMAASSCLPTRPVPVCHFHGSADEFAPLEGGIGRKSLTKTDFYSVEQSLHCWIIANGCEPTPLSLEALPLPHQDGTSITRRVHQAPRHLSQGVPAEVVLYLVHGGGHTWPGRNSIFTILGKSTKNLSANQAMWAFFQKHRREVAS